jgi:hypothetical protein
MTERLYIVRLYDGFDNQWCDVTMPVSRAEAERVWNEYTANGTRAKEYADIDYYRIFPADTKMVFSDGFGER